MIPPWLARVELPRRGGRQWRFWFPLILLWPLLLVVGPVVILGALGLALSRGGPDRLGSSLRIVPVVWEVLTALGGLKVKVESDDGPIRIEIW